MGNLNGLSAKPTKKVYMSIEEFTEKMALSLEKFMEEVNEDIDNSEKEYPEDIWFDRWLTYIEDNEN